MPEEPQLIRDRLPEEVPSSLPDDSSSGRVTCALNGGTCCSAATSAKEIVAQHRNGTASVRIRSVSSVRYAPQHQAPADASRSAARRKKPAMVKKNGVVMRAAPYLTTSWT